MRNVSFFDSPVGWLRLQASDAGLETLTLNAEPSEDEQGVSHTDPVHPILSLSHLQLHEYFSGNRTRFDIPLDFHGTPFQESCWQALIDIPFGETRCYQDIALSIRNPKAVRAVGMANNRNPIAIIIPCHRVIGKNGSLVGFGGGLSMKQWLLTHEQ